jgi:hypothetical protein
MQFAISVLLAVLLSCAALLAQSAAPAAQPQIVQVHGTITDPLEAVVGGVKITFENKRLATTVTTNSLGVYEINLPLGDYTMTVRGPTGFRSYRRPLFHLVSPATLDATLLVGDPCGERIIVDSSGAPVTEQDIKAATEACRHEELVSIPSGDGLQLELSIRYGSRTRIGDVCSYVGEKTQQYQAPVFVTYDLFSLQADTVTYNLQTQIVEASGHVIAVIESAATQSSRSMMFKIENGRVVQVR